MESMNLFGDSPYERALSVLKSIEPSKITDSMVNGVIALLTEDTHLIVDKRIALAIRICIMDTNKFGIPFTCAISKNTYDNYVKDFSNDVLSFIPNDYLGIMEDHESTFIHVTSKEFLERILDDGFLTRSGNDDCSLGRGVYTFELGSGLLFAHEDYAIVFKSNKKRVKVIRTIDTPKAIGEVVFFEDTLSIGSDYQIIEGKEAIREFAKKNTKSQEDLLSYYCISEKELAECNSKEVRENFREEFLKDPYGTFAYVTGKR